MDESLKSCLLVSRDSAEERGCQFVVDVLTALIDHGTKESVATACGAWSDKTIEELRWISDRKLCVTFVEPCMPDVVIPFDESKIARDVLENQLSSLSVHGNVTFPLESESGFSARNNPGPLYRTGTYTVPDEK